MLDEPLLLLDLHREKHGRGSKAESVTTDDQGHQGHSHTARSTMQNVQVCVVLRMPTEQAGTPREGPPCYKQLLSRCQATRAAAVLPKQQLMEFRAPFAAEGALPMRAEVL
jgi:hypothetical protein